MHIKIQHTKISKKHLMAITFIALTLAVMSAMIAHSSDASPALHTIATITLPGQACNAAIDARAHRAVIVSVAYGITGYATTIDTASGRLLRTVMLGSNPTDVAVDEQTTRIFITDIDDGTVRTVDAHSGALLRTVAVGDLQPHDLQRIAVDARTNRVFVSTSPVGLPNPALSAVHMLDARSGAVLHTTMTGGGSLAADDRSGRVFAANLAGNSISMLDGRTGTLVRKVALGAGTGVYQLVVDGRTERVFAATDAGLQMIDAQAGRLLRTLALPGMSNEALLDDEAHGRVVAIESRLAPPYTATLRIVNARTGVTVRAITLTSAYTPALDQRHGRVIVGTARGVSAFDIRTGMPMWTFAFDTRTLRNMTVDKRSGRIILVASGTTDVASTYPQSGSVIVLDGRTGARQSVTPVTAGACALALDERTGHAIVVSNGSIVHSDDPWAWVPTWLRRHLPFIPRSSSVRTIGVTVSVLDVGC